ncbi:MAG: DUF4214 domain-containing protein [Clostridiales bacterium]|nr:DUF4214 domain-containing protein [Clostridiales bacterium]
MKTRILKILAASMTAILLFTFFPILSANVSASDNDQELREFVTRLYQVCLKRDPDNDGLNYWTGELKNKNQTGVAVASGFIFSSELQEKSYSNEEYVKVMYDAFFGREADADGLNYWVKCMNDGMNRQDIFKGFANSNEFFELCGSFDVVAGTYITEYDFNKVIRTNFFVERLYNVVLGRKCDKDGMMYWTNELLSGRTSGTSAAYGFFFAGEYADSNKYYSEYIDDLYKAIMGREADDAGRDFWVTDMKNGSSKEHVFNGFAKSDEFGSICSEYGIVRGSLISETQNTTNTLRPDPDKNGSGNGTTTAPVTTAPSGGNNVTLVNTDVKIKNSNIMIMRGFSDQIQFTDKSGNIVKVEGATFKSDNEEVAYVCPDGTVIGLSVGSVTVTVTYLGNTSYAYVTVSKYLNNIDSVPNSLTPQMFGAVGDGKHDDTQAFRDMFVAAFEKSYRVSDYDWYHCQAIYIPSGNYKITGAVIDENLKTKSGRVLEYCMFEITGAGRESTMIKFSGDVLFDARTSRSKPLFGFTTFKDIDFSGNNSNKFMIMDAVKNDGTQRMQFYSCGFGSFNSILYCEKSYVMLSEITFSYCKIANCGTASNNCKLFVLDNPQAVNWRFDYTDIESFHGDAFYFKTGTSVYINGGSIIPGPKDGYGTVFNFDIQDQGNLGPGNAPQVCVYGARFEIHPGNTLLKTNSNSSSYPKIAFQYSNVNSSASPDSIAKDWMIIKGGIDVVFENCYRCTYSRFNVDCSSFTGYIQPKVKYINCPDIKVEDIVDNSKVKTITGGMAKNNLHITIDDSYDFYLADGGYYHTVSDLKECRQNVKINTNSDYDTIGISDGKTITTKPYGYVEYVEITVPMNETWKGYTVSATLYDGSKKISDTVKIDFSKSQTYKLAVTNNGNYVDELTIKFSNSNKQNPNVNMSVVVVKK